MMVLASILTVVDPVSIGLMLAFWSWMSLARSIRNQVITLRNRDFIKVSQMMNIPVHKIVSNDLVPNMMSYIILDFIGSMRGALTSSMGLMMLGLIPYSPTNWGMMLSMATSQTGALYIPRAYWYVCTPMVALMLFQYGFLQLQNGLDLIFNPRLRSNQ